MPKNSVQSIKRKLPHQFDDQQDFGNFQVYTHQTNGLQVLHYHIPDTNVVTANITYKVGSVDERRGESGLAHMLEHMLFKPTKQDSKNRIESGAAMQFERDTGSILNANTSYDRTTYYFSFPKKHTDTVLELEANRMQDVILEDKEFLPERGNVLSEFDMYNSDPYFALEVAMRSAMFQSHAYDHEVIGFREDIEDYTVEKLQRFYEMYYQPNNATLMLIGDIEKDEALSKAEKYFGTKKNPVAALHRESAREPKITGPRSVTIERPGTTNILGFGFVQAVFPSVEWYTTELAMRVLAGGSESILSMSLLDSGLVSSLNHYIPASPQANMGLLFMRLSDGVTHEKIETLFHEEIQKLTKESIVQLLKKEKTKMLTDEQFNRVSSLGLANELTQYTAADALSAFSDTKSILDKVTPVAILKCLQQHFVKQTLLTGIYRSV